MKSIKFQVEKLRVSPKPSANPKTFRHITNAVILLAKNGVTNVAMLQRRTLQIRIFFAPSLFTQKLPKKYQSQKMRKKLIHCNFT